MVTNQELVGGEVLGRRRSLRLARSRSHNGRALGFTLIELMIVISIVLILVSIAAPIYSRSVMSAKEAVLKEDLFTLRSVIDQYTIDKAKSPQSLDDIIAAGYLKQIPVDPCTGARDTWVIEQSDTLLSIDQTQPGISDVHSGCQGNASDGTPYSSW
jgi:general secretion pathway protein G